MAEPTPHARGWLHRRWVLPAIVVGGLAIRIALLPTPGYVGDIDQFVDWVRHIAQNGLSDAYDEHLSFGPVMAFIWWVMGLVDPAVAAATDSAEPAVRIAMKVPSIAADLGLAGLTWFALRSRLALAVGAVAVVMLHPAIWFVSAWWGQYDSVYTALAVAAFLLAIRGHDSVAVVALVLAVMTKPQAGPLAIPFAAWFMARAGWGARGHLAIGAPVRRLAVLVVLGVATLAVLWVPFLAANGPSNYLAGLAEYQGGEFYGFLSLRAWNPWWLAQMFLGQGEFVADTSRLADFVTFRVIGYALTGLIMFVVGVCVLRRPTARVLAFSLAAAALVPYELLTTMHERYAFAALPILVFVLDQRRARWVVAAFGASFLANLLWSAQADLGVSIPFADAWAIPGTATNVVCVVVLLHELLVASRRPESASAINDWAFEGAASTPSSTSGGSGAATSAA